MRNLEVGVETQMKNVIISSRMWLGLAPQAIILEFLDAINPAYEMSAIREEIPACS